MAIPDESIHLVLIAFTGKKERTITQYRLYENLEIGYFVTVFLQGLVLATDRHSLSICLLVIKASEARWLGR